MTDIEDLKTVKKCLDLCSKGDGKYCLICAYKKHNAKDVPPVCHLKLCADSLKTIENMEKIIEDQQERIDIMSEGGWIPVEKRLPEEKENPLTHDFCEVICYCQFGGIPKADDVRVFKFGNGHFYHGLQIMDRIVTHWQYLPELPKEGDQK